MIEEALLPFVSERFLNDERYRDGHLRIINALPHRRVIGMHIPDMKRLARDLCRQGGSKDIIRSFENEPAESLSYEEMTIWGYLVNMQKCTFEERLQMVSRFIPVMDCWAVCDSWCCNAKWIAKADRERMWAWLQTYFNSDREFEVRFAVIVSMLYFLREEWLDRIFDTIDAIDFSRIRSAYRTAKGKPAKPQEGTVQGAEPYYVRMGVAWLLASALAKYPDRTRDYVNRSQLPDDVIKLYIRKARESYRTRTANAL